MAYTRTDLVSAALNGLTINSTTTPSDTDVLNWINESDDKIDNRTGRVWGSRTFSSTYFDYDGTGELVLPFKPLISVTELKWETEGLAADSTTWSTLTEGRTNDFIVYKNEGRIKFFGSNFPSSGFQNICVSGTYGRSSTPKRIRELSTLLTAKRVIAAKADALARQAEGSVSVGNISLSDPSMFSVDRMKAIDEEIERLYKDISGFKTIGVTSRA